MSGQRDPVERVHDIVRAFCDDCAASSARLAATLDEQPEVRVYLDNVGARSIADLTLAQRLEMTDIIFHAMRNVVYPGAN